MRFYAAALMLVSGCAFHVQGGPSPGSGVESPGTPGTTMPGNAGNGGTGGGGTTGTPDPDPNGGNSGNPNTPPATVDMAMAGSPDMTMTGPPPLAVHVGQACVGDPDCMEPDLKCFHTLGKGGGLVTLPGGYCSKPCDSKVPCPTGSECIATVYGAFCMNICPSGGCRTGYACCESVNACGLDQFCSGGQGGG